MAENLVALTLQKLAKAEIASPPGVYLELKELIENPDGTFEDISQVIEKDTSLTARLLKIVNSPFYGMSGKVESISHALGIIGSDQLSELALATSLVSEFEGINSGLFDIKNFWMHSLGCGIAARLIGEFRKHPHSERLYLAGMLHDIGKLVILKEAPDLYQNVLSQVGKSDEEELTTVESKILGFNHAQVGWVLLKEWKLPASLVSGVQHHHHPTKSMTNGEEVAIIHVADFLVCEMGFRGSGECGLPPLHKEALIKLDLNLEFIKKIKEQIEAQTQAAVDLFFT